MISNGMTFRSMDNGAQVNDRIVIERIVLRNGQRLRVARGEQSAPPSRRREGRRQVATLAAIEGQDDCQIAVAILIRQRDLMAASGHRGSSDRPRRRAAEPCDELPPSHRVSRR
jgi:hypothetical protein